jgi:hypothetical protein
VDAVAAEAVAASWVAREAGRGTQPKGSSQTRPSATNHGIRKGMSAS